MPLSLPGASFTKGAGSGMLNMLKKKIQGGEDTADRKEREKNIYNKKKGFST